MASVTFSLISLICLFLTVNAHWGEQECWKLLFKSHCLAYEHCAWVDGFCWRSDILPTSTTTTTVWWQSCMIDPPGPNCPYQSQGSSSSSKKSMSGTTITAIAVGGVALCVLVAIVVMHRRKSNRVVEVEADEELNEQVVIGFDEQDQGEQLHAPVLDVQQL
eukprot:TRINITY_DN4775_c0_g1_i1.p1 TRINITY_DN4775_c0_g1~~TRINITY_DN4775_c0_g1_i1.p1  ORF type:complete len:162 (+),score=27.12 TRINITY_DN4775_c0_g1_i1:140-625(+)